MSVEVAGLVPEAFESGFDDGAFALVGDGRLRRLAVRLGANRDGAPLVLAEPTAPAAEVLRTIAERLGKRPRGLSGLSLGLTPASRF